MPNSSPEFRWEDQYAMTRAHDRGDLKRVRQLLVQAPALKKYGPFSGGTWLHYASEHGRTELVRFWLDQGIPADVDSRGNRPHNERRTPLFCAKNFDVAKLLLARGAEATAWQRGGGTPLHRAAQMNSPEMIQLLLKAGADPSIIDGNRRTPLGFAIWGRWRRSEKALRAANAPLEGRSPPDQRVPTKPPAIDLRQDAKRIARLIDSSIRRFQREHPTEEVNAFGLVASGVGGCVTTCFDSKEKRKPWNHHATIWDASPGQLAIELFARWKIAYERGNDGEVKITRLDGKRVKLPKRWGDAHFDRPFFDACVTLIQRAEKAGKLCSLRRGANFMIGVDSASGAHVKFWRPKSTVSPPTRNRRL
jgi:Ankyrin repeats (3 copies)/Ankyrin repeat